MVDGNDKPYQTDTYYTGDNLELPKDPVVEGKDFTGWYDEQEKEIKGGEEVKSDLTITAHFDEQCFVKFVMIDDTGVETEVLSQYYHGSGEKIGTMPQDPFTTGKVFDKWVIKGTETEVTEETVVNESMTVVAVFRSLKVYKISAEYYYIAKKGDIEGQPRVFNVDLIEVEEHQLPYTITAPDSTQTEDQYVGGGLIYYPTSRTVKVEKDQFDENNECTVRIEYVPYTAEYDFVYKVKDLEGEGYSEIERAHQFGVLNSFVTPTVKTYPHYILEEANGADITQKDGQELEVKYIRKNYQLSYDTNGGSYVGGATVPYGTEQAVTSTVPQRTGYDFAGWYKDADFSEEADDTITIEKDTILYAKWTAKTVHYTIVYMLEEYNNSTGTTSYVYDNSRDATGEVDTIVYAY